MKYPKATIFVPVKNGERTLKKCIDSLLNLDYPKKEIWVIDNMSTDTTPKILKSYGKKIKWRRMSGRVSKMHNYILRNVKTKFLAYTNADCVVKKDWIKKRTKKAEETAQAILEFLKQEDYLIVDIYNACQVIAKKMMDYVNKNTQEDIELVIKREQTKTLQQLYAAEQRK